MTREDEFQEFKNSEATDQFNDTHDKLARALRLISKLKGRQIQQARANETMCDQQKQTNKTMTTISKTNKKITVLDAAKSKDAAPATQFSPTSSVRKTNAVDLLAGELMNNVEYSQLD